MPIDVVSSGSLYTWTTSFSSPVINASYAVGDIIFVVVMSNSISSNPSNFIRIQNLSDGTGMILYYAKMTSSGSSITVSGLSGSGDVRYAIIRGLDSLIKQGNVNGSATSINEPGKNFIICTTGNSDTTQFRDAEYTRVPSSNWPNTDYYTIAWREFTDSVVIPYHNTWGTNSTYAVFSLAAGSVSDKVIIFNPTSRSGSAGVIQTWTVPNSGLYRIQAIGAQGGYANLYNTSTMNLGGLGAKCIGDFQLSKGQIIKILVGQKGGDNPSNTRGGGGGGGTFVYNQTASTLLIAAGGGGGAGQYAPTSNIHAQLGLNGANGDVSSAGLGGTGGNGGGAGSYGGGGAGWLTDGTSASAIGGQRFNNTGNGGSLYSDGRDGGFGGGGGSYAGAGGGGGYSGGGAGGWSYSGNGGGGGSYNVGFNSIITLASSNENGLVTITDLTKKYRPNRFMLFLPKTRMIESFIGR